MSAVMFELVFWISILTAIGGLVGFEIYDLHLDHERDMAKIAACVSDIDSPLCPGAPSSK